MISELIPDTGQKILLTISDEVYGEAVLRFASKHEWSGKPKFYLLNVVEPVTRAVMTVMAADDMQRIFDQEEAAARTLLWTIETRLRNAVPDASIESLIRRGAPKEEILKVAEEIEADCMILGSHGRTGLKRFMLGSVSLAVVAHSPCTVVIVRVSKDEALMLESEIFAITEEDLPQSMGSFAPTPPTRVPAG